MGRCRFNLPGDLRANVTIELLLSDFGRGVGWFLLIRAAGSGIQANTESGGAAANRCCISPVLSA